MPKKKPDQVIVHRIELQETERQLLRDVAFAYSFNRTTEPIVELINDNTTMLLILSAAAAYLGFTYIPPALEEGINLAQDWYDQYQAALEAGTILRERVDVVTGAIARGPLWGVIDLYEALTGTNLPDFGSGYEPNASSGGGGGF